MEFTLRTSFHLWLATALLTICPAAAFGTEPTVVALAQRLIELSTEEANALNQIEALEATLKTGEEELARLQSLAITLGAESTAPTNDPPEVDPLPAETAADQQTRERELVAAAASRIAFLTDKDGPFGTGFFAPRGEGLRIFTAPPLISEHRSISVVGLDDEAIPVGTELTCPVGVELVCLHPTNQERPSFELAPPDELPNVGDRVVVILANPETHDVTGIGGAIRSIGPDTWELDAMLLPGMNGAPHRLGIRENHRHRRPASGRGRCGLGPRHPA
ncbi:MAG: hypothetical protein O3A87_03645 [Verrucomicrobia bacterium]|nr:hypothetical protein [Verrucomicrobiota bacterium]MDA1005557.1 hypothetical protein [Verrucomicrobiota bacterium]